MGVALKAQTGNFDALNVKTRFYLRQYRIDTVKNDTNYLQGNTRSLMTADAIYKFVKANSGGAGADTSNLLFRNGNGGLDPLSYYIGTKDSIPLIMKMRDTTMGMFVGIKGLYYPSVSYMEYLDDVSLGAGALQKKLTRFPDAAKGIVAIGPGAGRNYAGASGTGANIWIGRGSGRDDSLSYRSIHIGEYNGFMGPGGSHNTSVGAFGLEVNRGGNYNASFASDALRSNKMGSFNNAFGFFSLLQNNTIIDTILVTEGGSGYTSAPTVVISAPEPASPGTLSIQATATAVLNGDSVQYVLMTQKGAGYSDYNPLGPVTVTFTGGGGSGAAATPVLVSGDYNSAFGYAAGAFNRSGDNGIYIGKESGMGIANASPSYYDDDVLFIGTGSSRSTSVPWNKKLIKAGAIGYNSKVARDSILSIGSSLMKGVAINGDTVYRNGGFTPVLDVWGGMKASYIINEESGYRNYIAPSQSYKGFPNVTFVTGHGSTGNDGAFYMGSLSGNAYFGMTNNVGARSFYIQNVYGYKPMVFQVTDGERARFADTTGNFILYKSGEYQDRKRLLQVKGTSWFKDSLTFASLPTGVKKYALFIDDSGYVHKADTTGLFGGGGGGSMVYPGAGIPVSTGSAWGTSITDNSSNWNTAYSWGNHAGLYFSLADTSAKKWDWGDITGRPSLMLTTDTASMLATYLQGTGASGRVAFFTGTRTILGDTKLTHTNGLYPTLGLVGSDPLYYAGAVSTTNPSFGQQSGGAVINGGSNQKSILFNSHPGVSFAMMYNNGTTKSMTLYKTALILDTLVGGLSDGTVHVAGSMGDSTSTATTNNTHVFRAIAGMYGNGASANNYYSSIIIGNTNAGATQGHGAGWQSDFKKTGANTVQQFYHGALLADSIKNGTLQSRYGFRMWDAIKLSGAMLDRQAFLKLEKMKAATAGQNYFAIIDSADYVQLDGKFSFEDDSARVRDFNVKGTTRFRDLGTASADTTTYKPLGISSSGDVISMTYWPGGGGGAADGNNYLTSVTYEQDIRTMNFSRSGLADLTVQLPLANSSDPGLMSAEDKRRLDSNSYLLNPIHPDSILAQKNDTVIVAKAVTVESQLPDIYINTIRTDTTLKHQLVKLDINEPIISFTAGAGFAADTTVFTDSTLYGSFYTGQDSFYVTKAFAVLKGQSGDTLGVQIVYNDTFNVTGTVVGGGTLAVNNRTTGNSFDISTNSGIPPNMWVWLKSPTVVAGKKPEYLSVTLIGYRKYIAP